MVKNINKLKKFITNNSVNKYEKATHVDLSDDTYFLVDGDNVQEFWENYCSEVIKNNKLQIAEITDDNVPLTVGVTIRYSNKNKQDDVIYTKKFVKELVKIYQECIYKCVDINEDPDRLICYVLSSDVAYYNDKNRLELFQLFFPRCVVSKITQKAVIREMVINTIKQENTISQYFTDVLPVNDINDIINDNIPSNMSIMYGSYINNVCKLELSHVYDINQENILDNNDDIVDKADIYSMKTNSLNYNSLSDKFGNDINSVMKIINMSTNEHKHDLLEVLPKYKKLTEIDGRGKTKDPKYMKILKEQDDIEEFTEQDTIEILLSFIDKKRAMNKNTWKVIGNVIYNNFDFGNEDNLRGYELWKKFSSKRLRNMSIYESEEDASFDIEDEWDNMIFSEDSIGILYCYARLDSSKEYRAWINQRINILVGNSLKYTGGTSDITEIIYLLFYGDYICTNIRNNEWYYFKNHRWRCDPGALKMEDDVLKELLDIYNTKLIEFRKSLSSAKNKAEKQMYGEFIDRTSKMIKSFKDNTDMYIKKCMKKFYLNTFIDIVDTNPNLMCFENGVFDCENMEFREGLPTDYCTKSTRYNYKEYKYNHPRVKYVLSYMKQVFVDDNIRHYIENFMGSSIRGENIDAVLSIFTGTGRNSKSLFKRLIMMAHGGYCAILPPKYLTSPDSQSGNATPEEEYARNAKIAFIDETSKTDTFNDGKAKRVTGGDPILSRQMYSSEYKERILLFKVILITNNPPRCKSSGRAEDERFKLVPFESTFTNNYPEDIRDQIDQKIFPKDIRLADNLNKMIQPFAWLMIQWYKRYVNEGLPDCKKIDIASKMYKEKNNYYYMFNNESISRKDGNKVTLIQLYNAFTDWFQHAYPGNRVPNRGDFKEEITKEIGKPRMNGNSVYWKDIEVININSKSNKPKVSIMDILNSKK